MIQFVLSCRVVVCHGAASKFMQLKRCLGLQSGNGLGVIHFVLCCGLPWGCIKMHAPEELLRIAKLDWAWSDPLCVVLWCAMGLHQNACN